MRERRLRYLGVGPETTSIADVCRSVRSKKPVSAGVYSGDRTTRSSSWLFATKQA